MTKKTQTSEIIPDWLSYVDALAILFGTIVFILFFASKMLQEDSLNYYCSALAQTSAGVYAFIIAASAFLNFNFSKQVDSDETYLDAVAYVRVNYYYNIIKSSLFCFLSIVLALSCIYLYSCFSYSQPHLIKVSFSVASASFCIQLLYCFLHVVYIASPRVLERTSDIIISKMDTGDQQTMVEEEKDVEFESNSLNDYLSDFYELEQDIKNLIKSPYQNNYPLYKAIDILYKSGKIDYYLSVPGRIVTFSTKTGILRHWKRDLAI